MPTWLFSPLVRWGAVALVIGVLGLALKFEMAKVSKLKGEIRDQKVVIEFFKKAARIDADTAREKEAIHEAVNSGDPRRIHDVLNRLRQLSAADNGN